MPRPFVATALSVALLVVSHVTPATALNAKAPPVVFVDASAWNDSSAQPLRSPPASALTRGEQQRVERAVRDLPTFPPNAFSGCHARAEVVARRLKVAGGEKVFKVWLFSGQAIAPALTGGISYKGATWDYHVAAAFLDASSVVRVVDPLVSKSPISVDDWVARFEIRGVALLTYLEADRYLFNRTTVPALDEQKFPDGLRQSFMARNVLNGEFYGYTGDALERHEGARDLAADVLAQALLTLDSLRNCPWRESASKGLKLKQLADDVSPPDACKAGVQLFKDAASHWMRTEQL